MYVYCFVIEQFPFVCWKDCQIVFSICSTLWLVWKSCPTISTIQMQNWDQLWAVHLYFFILQAVCLVLVWVFISFSLLFLALTAGCDHLVLFSQHSIKKKYMYLGQSLDVIAGWKREGVEASYTRLAFFDMYVCSFIENEMWSSIGQMDQRKMDWTIKSRGLSVESKWGNEISSLSHAHNK